MDASPTPSRTLRVGAAAAAAGVHVQTLHYYEREGLIRRPSRTASGYRQYPQETVRTVRAIKEAQALGFTLQEIRELGRIGSRGRPSADVGRLARRKLADIERKIDALVTMRDRLRVAVESCACGGDLGRCDVLGSLGAPGGSTTHPD